MNWAKEVAMRIVEERPDEEVYTVASGVSPSGFVHIGNFREIATPYLVAKELKKLGKKVRYILSFDEFDRFRKRDNGTETSVPTETILTPASDVLLQAILNGEDITREQALSLPAVSGAVDLISS